MVKQVCSSRELPRNLPPRYPLTARRRQAQQPVQFLNRRTIINSLKRKYERTDYVLELVASGQLLLREPPHIAGMQSEVVRPLIHEIVYYLGRRTCDVAPVDDLLRRQRTLSR